MNFDAASYWLGVGTPLVLAGLILVGIIAYIFFFEKKAVGRGPCPHCAQMGKSYEYQISEHTHFVCWLLDVRHHLRARYNKQHREYWQAWFETIPVKSTVYRRVAPHQNKYGVSHA